jgi:hypothetical protein
VEKEAKRNMYHLDDELYGKGIIDMLTRVMAATDRD